MRNALGRKGFKMAIEELDDLTRRRQERLQQQQREQANNPFSQETLMERRRQRQGDQAVMAGNAQAPAVNLESPGVNPLTRAKMEYLSDTPQEMQLAIQREFGPDAVLVRGADLGFPADSAEGRSTFYSRNMDSPFEVFDPTAQLQFQRAGGGMGGVGAFAAEIGAEAVETLPQYGPEIAVEVGLLAADRFIPGLGSALRGGRRLEAGGRRLAGGAVRGGAFAATSATAVSLSDALRQGTQTLAGTQDQEGAEVLAQNMQQAAMAGGLSAFFSGAGMIAGRGVDLILGRASPEGAASLNAARQVNQAIAAGELTAEGLEQIALPLAGYYSNSPLTKRIFGYLGRLSPEISLYQRNMRDQLDTLGQMMANENTPTAIAAANSELIGALNQMSERLTNRLIRNANSPDPVMAGVDALSHIGSYKEVTGARAGQLYDDAYATMAREFGDGFQVRYDWTALREARAEATRQRNLPRQVLDSETGNFVDAPPIQTQFGDASAWNAYDRIAPQVDAAIRGQQRLPPRTIIGLIETINDELAGAPVDDRGRAALLNLKSGLNDALDSIPRMNDGLGEQSITRLRAAQDFYANRQRTLEDAGVLSMASLAMGRDYYRAATTLFETGDPNRLRQFRDVVLQTEDGARAWNETRNAYLVHAINREGNPGNAWRTWNNMQTDVKQMLFPDANERALVARSLRDLDVLHNSTGFNAVQEAAETSGNFVADVVGSMMNRTGGGGADATRLVREAVQQATDAGNPMPQRAFDAGVWQHVLQSSRRQTPDGQTFINPTMLNNQMRELRLAGVLDIMSPESRAFLDNFQDLASASTFDLRDGGAGLAAAQFASDLIDPSKAAGAAMKLLSLRTISTGLVAANPQLARYAAASGMRETGTNLPTFLSRMGYYYAADENQVSGAEWNAYMRAMARAQDELALTPQQRGMRARGLAQGRMTPRLVQE